MDKKEVRTQILSLKVDPLRQDPKLSLEFGLL